MRLQKKSGWVTWMGLCLAGSVQAGALVDLSAEASRSAQNDLLRATVYTEQSGNQPAELAKRVNVDVAAALKLAKAIPGISVKTGQQGTYPVYANNVRKIDSWRMRVELLLESRDAGALSELLGNLQQQRMLLGNIQQTPSPETRHQVEDETTRDALQAFQNRAKLVAASLGKTYKIKQLSINHNGGFTVMPMFKPRMAAVAMEAAPAPVEAGESQLTTTVTGQIELAD